MALELVEAGAGFGKPVVSELGRLISQPIRGLNEKIEAKRRNKLNAASRTNIVASEVTGSAIPPAPRDNPSGPAFVAITKEQFDAWMFAWAREVERRQKINTAIEAARLTDPTSDTARRSLLSSPAVPVKELTNLAGEPFYVARPGLPPWPPGSERSSSPEKDSLFLPYEARTRRSIVGSLRDASNGGPLGAETSLGTITNLGKAGFSWLSDPENIALLVSAYRALSAIISAVRTGASALVLLDSNVHGARFSKAQARDILRMIDTGRLDEFDKPRTVFGGSMPRFGAVEPFTARLNDRNARRRAAALRAAKLRRRKLGGFDVGIVLPHEVTFLLAAISALGGPDYRQKANNFMRKGKRRELVEFLEGAKALLSFSPISPTTPGRGTTHEGGANVPGAGGWSIIDLISGGSLGGDSSIGTGMGGSSSSGGYSSGGGGYESGGGGGSTGGFESGGASGSFGGGDSSDIFGGGDSSWFGGGSIEESGEWWGGDDWLGDPWGQAEKKNKGYNWWEPDRLGDATHVLASGFFAAPAHHEGHQNCRFCGAGRDPFARDDAFTQPGRIFTSRNVIVDLAELGYGEYGDVRVDGPPFRVRINVNESRGRAKLALAHELVHVMDLLAKTDMSHEQVVHFANLLVSDVVPALLAFEESEEE